MYRVIFVLLVAFISGCASTYPNQDPTGKTFPDVSGQTLEKRDVNMPDLFKGKQTLLLIGYKQDSQFDIDRWLIGLDMTRTMVDVYELPTIAGMAPRMFKGFINDGMRAGIPKPLWKGVITIYDDGAAIQAFTGNENPNNARVILLDPVGKIMYFYDQGFSVAALNEVRSKIIIEP